MQHWCFKLFIVGTVLAVAGLASALSPREAFQKSQTGIFVPFFVGKGGLCRKYADKSKSNRCDAEKVCVSRGEKVILGKIKNSKSKEARLNLLTELAQLYSTSDKHLKQTVETFEKAYEVAKEVSVEKEYAVLGQLGVAQMRYGEVKNCSESHTASSCIFPLNEQARHSDQWGSKAALKSYNKYLKKYPDNLHIRWLLNIVHQTLGSYPDGVPKKFLISEKYYKTKEGIGFFKEIAQQHSFFKSEQSGGAVADDFNGDGLLDIMITSRGACDPSYYYENDGKGGFIDRSKESGLLAQVNAGQMFQADYDNDGDLDVLLTRGAWASPKLAKKFPTYNSIMQNDGSGRFRDVSKNLGIDLVNTNVASAWADFNNDGYLDLFVCNEQRSPDLWMSQKAKKFVNAIEKSGIKNSKLCKGIAVGDVNNDGFADLFIANFYDKNQLYLNKGGGKFVLDEQEVLQNAPILSFPAWMFDYNNDGWLDLFVAGFDANSTHYVESLLGQKKHFSHRLFKNTGHGKFKDVTAELNLDRSIMTMGANFGDINNDGRQDMLLATGGIGFADIQPNTLYLNKKSKFVDIASESGFSNLQKGHGVSFADLDNDGDQDVLVQLGGSVDGDRFFPSLLLNPGHGQQWVTLRLRGTKSARSAIGSRVKVVVDQGNGESVGRGDGKDKDNRKIDREIHRMVQSGSSFGANSLQLEIGLGSATKIKSIEVVWAGSLKKQTWKNVPINSIVELIEGASKEKVLKLPKLNLEKKNSEHHHHH